ncbi:MAG: D-glycero-beta-D-manno-heptose 1,7-bisphosphate 7-phosphatase [Clostridia bacterium]|nr:D-glycero-beta-D-manno-heptose 1,7-bisphosphate 7-phosphatase [Clostridia bacterium]
MEAIILAGGLGTRLKPCVENLPKPLAPIDGKPFLNYLLDYLYVNGVHRAVISTGYKAETIEEYIGRAHRGMVVDYCREDTPLGTGGAIKKALGMCRESCVCVINGDTYFDVSLPEMKSFHDNSGCKISLAAKWVENAENSGFLRHENGRLCGFHEKGIMSAGLINGGIYFIEKDALDGITEEKFSLEKQILESDYCPVAVYESNGYFIDIGIPENYKKAEKNKEKLFSKRTRKAVFLDRDGTINHDTGHLYRTEDFKFLENADKAIAEIKSKGYLAIIITNQAGIAKGLYKSEDVDILHAHIDSLLLKNFGITADGYYYCPHHPEAVIEELKKECLCRKPNAGLILKAVSDFSDIGIEIDLKGSFTAGNKLSDVLAGINAGTGQNILIGQDEPDTADIASAHYENLYDFSQNLKQVL